MTKTQKSVLVAVFLWTTLLIPAHTFAMTQAEIDTQRVALIEQLVAVLQEKLAELVAQLEAQQGEIIALKASQPVFGSTTPAPVVAPYDFTVTSIEHGSGSWEEYSQKCHGAIKDVIDPSYNCQNGFLDGTVRFTVSGEHKSLQLTYYPTNDPKTVVTTGAIFQKGVAQAGFFFPETEYHWSITAKNKTGQTATKEGKFKTGSYPI